MAITELARIENLYFEMKTSGINKLLLLQAKSMFFKEKLNGQNALRGIKIISYLL
jgi:hypothetical protein